MGSSFFISLLARDNRKENPMRWNVLSSYFIYEDNRITELIEN